MNQDWVCLLHIYCHGTHPLGAEQPVVGTARGTGLEQLGESPKWKHIKAMAVCKICYLTNNPMVNQLSYKVKISEERKLASFPRSMGQRREGREERCIYYFNLEDSQLGKIVRCWLFSLISRNSTFRHYEK